MKKFFMDESGQGMVEYGLIIALIAIAIIALVEGLGTSVGNVFSGASGKLTEAMTD